MYQNDALDANSGQNKEIRTKNGQIFIFIKSHSGTGDTNNSKFFSFDS